MENPSYAFNPENQLSDNQLSEVTKKLEELKSEDSKLLQEIVNNDTEPDDIENMEASESTITEDGLEMDVIEEKLLSIDDINKSEEELSEDLLSKTAKNELDLSDEETLQLMNVIKRYKNKEKMNLYKELPTGMKKQIQIMTDIDTPEKIVNNMKQLQLAAKMIIDGLITDTQADQLLVDFEKTMEELEIPSLTDLYNDLLKEDLEESFKSEKITAIREKHPDVADRLDDFINGFKEGYSYNRMIEFLDTESSVRNRALGKDLKHYDKIVGTFNTRASRSKMKLYSAGDILPVLINLNYSEDNGKRFIICFCRICEGLDFSNIGDTSFIYYFVRNIKTLVYSDNSKSEFTINLLATIEKCMNKINDLVDQKGK